MAISASSLVVDDHIFLNGRPPLGEYLGFVVGQTVDGATADRARLAADWRAANDRVKELERTEAGIADDAELGELPDAIASLGAAALQHPGLQQSYALVPTSIAMVDLDRALVYQKAINLGQVARLQGKLGSNPSDEEVFRVCFPLGRELDPPFGAQEGGDGWTFVSPSNDFRFLGARLLAPSDVPGSFGMPGAPVAVMALAVGYSINVLAAARVEGRIVLTNGSHRAFALYDLGIRQVPCLVQEISRREELELLGVDELLSRNDAYLSAPRPPMLRDYFDPALRIVGAVPRKDRHVQVAFKQNPIDLPAPPR